jgi:hypothetical protein
VRFSKCRFTEGTLDGASEEGEGFDEALALGDELNFEDLVQSSPSEVRHWAKQLLKVKMMEMA